MKALKKFNKLLFSMDNPSGSRRELKNIDNIKCKAPENYSYYIRNGSIIYLG